MGTLIGFDFGYFKVDEDDMVGKYLDLGSYGRIDFHLNFVTHYGRIVTPDYEDIIRNFLDNYPESSDVSEHIRKPYQK
ncbi:hypothetical protein [Listeria phage List-36]|nr:hypothetical protein QLX35_gp182 [Listeria phage LP-125]YP_009042875.1 hypothetical protein LP048_067 [Listeria phage LP-048]YP_009043078.1 hypothetical protein HH39_gp180 [Listeria phage LMSP-25]YP_009043482.1 hypothetical protein HH35_gp106 [Listeria phage List-36]YP_009044538.1 hypothetical protein LP083-2_082 [Listeria phage LP-083-2]YP_009055662.1 hypothetical protein LD12_gp170 [Listeria phage LMTA-148]YP_009592615.1 hypothetical protein FDG78_gp181 [Listeria phage LP-064]YP_0096161